MQFQFLPLRFDFLAREAIEFPEGKAANTLRGALGSILQSTPEAYARIFAPAAPHTAPSGLADPPRPFVFRARHLDGCTIPPGKPFHFHLHLFSLDPAILAVLVDTFAAIAHEGLGPRRGKAELQSIRRIAFGNLPEQVLNSTSLQPATLAFYPVNPAPARIRIDFLSPTELKHGRRLAARPEFPILFARIRDRISTLRSLYGPGPLELDFSAAAARSQAVSLTRCQVQMRDVIRHSTRTGQRHSLGGFVGFAEYQGQMSEFLPYLEAARWTGVGRQAVWGKGEISLGI